MTDNKTIPLMVPDIREEDISEAINVLRSGMLIQGRYVELLEEKISEYIGIKHAIAVSSGTATLHLALVALGIGKGDEVILPAFSFIATANVVEIVGARPVFVDIDMRTFNMDTTLIEAAITPCTKAIIPVHEFGLACDITEVCRIAIKHNLAVIEDAACALGATENNKHAGTFGSVGSFSFHPRKAITSGEGGMLVTNDDHLADKFRILRNHGITNANGKLEFVEAGFNYRMTDFQAALLCSQFERYAETLAYKQSLAQQYYCYLNDEKWIQLPHVPENKIHSWQSYHVVVENDRDGYIKFMKLKGIGTNLGAQCMPDQDYYKKKYNLNCETLFPSAMKAYRNGLVLPLYQKLKNDDVALVAALLKTYS